MSEAQRIQEVVDTFLREFLRPLLTGGTVRLARAIAPAVLDAATLSASTDADSDFALREALHDAAADFVPPRPLVWPDRDAMALAIACHNLALLTDPMLDRAFARGARATIAEYIETLTASAAPVRTRGSALIRHAIVARFLTLARTDTIVRNWAYTYRFYGRAVPARFTAWKGVRRVRTETQRKPLEELLGALPPALSAPELRAAIIAQSPVTRILQSDPSTFRVDATIAAVLSDQALRGGLVRALLDESPARAAEAIGAALLHQGATLRSGSGSEPALIRATLLFAFELQATALLGRGAPISVGTPESFAAVAAFAALIGTAEGGELAELRSLDPDDLRVLRNAAIDARHRIGKAAFEVAHTLVLACFGPTSSALAWTGERALSPALEAAP